MGSHGIRNRSPHAPRVSPTSLTPQAPSNWSLLKGLVGALAVVALWAATIFVFSL